MSHPAVSFEDATRVIGILPSLAPRPNSTNLRCLTVDLEDKLTTIPSEQSADWGYSGMITIDEIYGLKTGGTHWTNWADPGPHRATGGTSAQQRDAGARYDADKKVFDSEANVRRAINAALNIAVPREYRGSAATVGARVYKPNECPKAILARLRDIYGRTTPAEKKANETLWSQNWNPADPIEALFMRLEECFVFALASKPPYTEEQMVDKAITAIQSTGLYETAILEWQGFDDANKTWPELKSHFGEAYEIRIASGAGTARGHGYANNTMDDDDDSIASITQSIHTIQLANNASNQVMNDNISQITSQTESLRQAIADTQQQLAMLANAAPTITYQQPVPPPHYMPPAAAYNAYAPTPPPPYQPPQQYQPRGNTRRAPNSRRNGRNNRNSRSNQQPGQTTAPAPFAPTQGQATTGGLQPFRGGNTNTNNSNRPAYSNKVKYYNNWNMCYSCGFDVPNWHTSATCDNPDKRAGHDAQCTRQNCEAYIAGGYPICKVAKHKNQLPTNPRPDQA